MVYGAHVIEIMTFELRADVNAEGFVETDARVQTEVAYRCPGLLRRTLARNADRWLVVQVWASPEDGRVGRSVLESSALGQRFLEFVDGSTVSVELFDNVA